MSGYVVCALAIAIVAHSGECHRSAPTSPDRHVQTGTWGGQGVALTVTPSGGRLEFDCASGEITEQMTTDADGRLTVAGVFVQEQGGPIRIGEEPERQRARYSGRLTGQTLTLEVVLTASNQTVGSFTLVYGALPRLRKCR